MQFLKRFLLSSLSDFLSLLRIIWRLGVWLERHLMKLLRLLWRLGRRIVRVERRIRGHYHKLLFPFRWLRFVIYRFHVLPPWAKLLKLVLLIVLLSSPYLWSSFTHWREAGRLYDQYYPHFYAEYLKKKLPEAKARYYASYYARYYADYYASEEYRVALQYALPKPTKATTSYPATAPTAALGLTPEGVAMIKHFEGLMREPYVDAGGKLTIGYGHLIHPGELYTELSETEAEALLRDDIRVAEAVVKRNVAVELTSHQYSALVSLVYNIGSGHFEKSTLLDEINDGDFEEAAEQFLRWDNVKGRRLTGLTRRRIAERELFLRS